MLTVLRREEKYALTTEEAVCYANRFSQFLQPDTFSHNGNYMVRSLYFDTPSDKDYFDKLNEQNLRRKIRLRIYSPQDRHVKLELKQKENIYQKKQSLSISRRDAAALIHEDYSVLLQYHQPLAAELYTIMVGEAYRPRSIVEYQRRAFTATGNNIRVTFDSCINANEGNFDLFSATLPLYSVMSRSKTILEVKYNHFMPGYLSVFLSQIDRRSISSSKYCLSRQLGYPCSF